VKYELDINGVRHTVHVDPDVPLLWVVRDYLGLTGTKYGCGVSLCGACTVHVEGQPVRSCVVPIADAVGKEITTIEGLSADGSHALQRAWVECDVPQCGYCQAGQIMSAAALLRDNPRPSDDEIRQAMSGNLCRCGTYCRIRRAIRRASESISST
jgi:isoquinoline 1-oxidoreductase subunit alpha